MAALLALTGTVRANDQDLTALRGQIMHSFRQDDPRRALDLIGGYLELAPGDGAMIYNAACAHCRLGELERAERHLLDAIKAGFQAFSSMSRDPDIAPLRGRPIYRAVMAARQAADGALAKRRVDTWRARMSGYHHERDEARRIDFLSALPPAEQARLRQVTATNLAAVGALLDDPPRTWMLVALVAPPDAADILPSVHVRGRYQHEVRQLVATDLDQSLGHELAHAVHHHDMDRRGQDHPMWIQEGIACLFEAIAVEPDGRIQLPSTERDRQTRTLAAAGDLLPWSELFALSAGEFGARAAVAYPQVRSLLRFVAGSGLLRAWYDVYVSGFDADPTGAAALERVFGRPLHQIESEWRDWIAEPAAVSRVDPGLRVATEVLVSGASPPGAAPAAPSADGRRHYQDGLACMRRGDLPSAWVSWAALRPLDPSLASLLENLMRHAVRPGLLPAVTPAAGVRQPRAAACPPRGPASL
jgi:hypothetical protein